MSNFVEKRKRILPSNIREIRATEVVKLGTRERILPENIKEIRSPKYVKSLPTEVKKQRILPSNIREIKPLELVKLETKTVEEKTIAKRILPTNIREIKSPRFVKELPLGFNFKICHNYSVSFFRERLLLGGRNYGKESK